VTWTLETGRTWYRISKRPFKPDQFNFTKADNPYKGGRFDSLSGDFGYTYLASTLASAVDEVLLRDAPFSNLGARSVPSASLIDRYYVEIDLQDDLELLNLISVDALAQVGQGYWLTDCDGFDYMHTRFWTQTLRSWAPNVSGFVWRPRHNHEDLAVVLFKDVSPTTLRADPVVAAKSPEVPISGGVGRDEIANILAQRHAWLS